MMWYEEHVVRALQQARLTERRPRASRPRRVAASTAAVKVALRLAPVR